MSGDWVLESILINNTLLHHSGIILRHNTPQNGPRLLGRPGQIVRQGSTYEGLRGREWGACPTPHSAAHSCVTDCVIVDSPSGLGGFSRTQQRGGIILGILIDTRDLWDLDNPGNIAADTKDNGGIT